MMWELDVLEKVPCRHPGEKCRDETGYIHSWEVTCLISPSHRYFWTNSAVAWCKNKEAAQTFIQSASQHFDQCRLAAAREYVAVGPVSVTSHFELREIHSQGSCPGGSSQKMFLLSYRVWKEAATGAFMVHEDGEFIFSGWSIHNNEWNVNKRVKDKKKLVIGSVGLAGCSS